MTKSRKSRPAPIASVGGGSPFTERGFILSGALLGIGVLCGTLAVFTASGDEPEDAADPAAAGPAVAAPQLPPAERCPAPPTPAAGAANSPPPDVSWTPYRGVFVPVSDASGPLAAHGDVARCFSHSPSGALLAAVHISARYAFAPDWRAIAEYQIVADPARNSAVERRAKAEQANGGARQGLLDPQKVRQVEGYQIVSYADEAATVRILTATPSGGPLMSSMYAMVWTDGDWKLQMQPSGSTSVSTQELPQAPEFTVWNKNTDQP